MDPAIEDQLLNLTYRTVCTLVDHSELADVIVDGAGDGVCRNLVRTGPGELGQVIGRQGRNLEAIRVVVQAVAARYHIQAGVEVIEPAAVFRVDSSRPDGGSRSW